MDKSTQNLVAVTSEKRAVYQNIKEFLGLNPEAIVSRGALRLEQVGGAQSRYQFHVLQDEGTVRPSEIRLSRTDAFFIDELAFFIGKRALGATPQNFGEYDLHTWANALVFPGTTELQAARTLMNSGRASLEVDQVKYLAQWDVLGNRFVGTAQDGLDAGGGELYEASAWDRACIMRGMTPSIRLNGGSENILSLSVNEGINFTGEPLGETPTENVVIAMAYGWRAANAGEFTPSRRT